MNLVREILRFAQHRGIHLINTRPTSADVVLNSIGIYSPRDIHKLVDMGEPGVTVLDYIGRLLHQMGIFPEEPEFQSLGSDAVAYTGKTTRIVLSSENDPNFEFLTDNAKFSSPFDNLFRSVSMLDTRSSIVLERRMGINGESHHTLEDIGGYLVPPITRERVRQIERKALARIQPSIRSVDQLFQRASAAWGLSICDPLSINGLASIYDLPIKTISSLSTTIERGLKRTHTQETQVLIPQLKLTAQSGLLIEAECVVQTIRFKPIEDLDHLINRRVIKNRGRLHRTDLITSLESDERIQALSADNTEFSLTGRLSMAVKNYPRGDGYYRSSDLVQGSINLNESKRELRITALQTVLADGPLHVTEIHDHMSQIMPPWTVPTVRSLGNYLAESDVATWVGLSTFGLKGAMGLSDQAEHVKSEYGLRRRGVADEIETYLLREGESEYYDIEQYILERFTLTPNSIYAAVEREIGRRFTRVRTGVIDIIDRETNP
jgi:hypothetical protein